MNRLALCILFSGIPLTQLTAGEPQPEGKPNVHRMEAHVYNPVRMDATDDRVRALRKPEGFQVTKFAEDLGNARIIAVAENGTIYVTRRENGDLLMLRDANGDGRADTRDVVAERPRLHGVAIDGRTMYLATVKDVYRTQIRDDGTLEQLERIIDDLPDGGQHPNRTLGVGPDRHLYISIGSTCNACAETNPEHATIVRATLDGKSRIVFARGLRNTLGFAWHPQTGQMWGIDHNTDWLGNDVSHEELNLLERGKHYGWPYIYDKGRPMPHREPPGDIPGETWREMCTDPVLLYKPHAAGMQMAFYTGDQFPREYQGDAFITMRGSWNRNPPQGYEVARIRFEGNRPVAIEPFLTGFLIREGENYGHMGRLVGLQMTPDGALVFCDDTNGVMYRVTYDQRRASAD